MIKNKDVLELMASLSRTLETMEARLSKVEATLYRLVKDAEEVPAPPKKYKFPTRTDFSDTE